MILFFVSDNILTIARQSARNAGAAAGAILLPVLLSGCATAPKTPEYLHTGSFTGTTFREIEAAQSINREKSYRVYFTLSQPEKCIRIKITSRRTVRESVYVEQPVYTYFILERAVDLRRFGPVKEPYIYSEIGRNYDSNWNLRGETEICTDTGDPIKKIEKGVYRIRFSVLENTAVNFKITIFSNNGEIAFSNNPPAAEQ